MEYYQEQVYKNPRWQSVRRAVIERDRDICFFCGKLILKKRTIHHIVEINEENYCDENVAFNLDNLVECHNTCHDRYHERYLQNKKTIVNDDLEIDYQRRGQDETQNTFYK